MLRRQRDVQASEVGCQLRRRAGAHQGDDVVEEARGAQDVLADAHMLAQAAPLPGQLWPWVYPIAA